MAKQQQELLGQPESPRHTVAQKKKHVWDRVLWGRGSGHLPAPGPEPWQVRKRLVRDCGKGFLQTGV